MMFRCSYLSFPILAILLTKGAAVQGDQKQPKDIKENIVGGLIAAETGKNWPFFVHLGNCGGSLVAPDVVLT